MNRGPAPFRMSGGRRNGERERNVDFSPDLTESPSEFACFVRDLALCLSVHRGRSPCGGVVGRDRGRRGPLVGEALYVPRDFVHTLHTPHTPCTLQVLTLHPPIW